MLVSWSWLCRYLDLNVTPEQLTDALSLSGLNHEETVDRNGEVVIDLEVTSNRGDCLGHLGVAREISVLFDLPLKVPNPQPATGSKKAADLLQVTNDYVEACPRYTARVIEGCKVGPSPSWLVESLAAIGLNSVNNVVDVTNYVMMECGQPLHAFDLALLSGKQICVRRAQPGETIQAIDHRSYALDPEMCVIADRDGAIAVAGVMGGADSEVTKVTKTLVIEAAIFTPMSVRQTARKLKLHSPSSYRFERRVDPNGVDWASRRACELILELAGGELAEGCLDTDPKPVVREPIVLRLSQIERVLGITVDRAEVVRILTALGCETAADQQRLTTIPPTWRHDLTREADLIEEVARIHGYDKIPEDSPIDVAPSARRHFDSALDKVRHTMLAAGISEAMTPSVVTEKLDALLSPWSDLEPLATITPLLKGANRLRRSLLPSLLNCCADNWAASGLVAELYEVAHIYLPAATGGTLPTEQYTLAIVSPRDFYELKGVVERLLSVLGIAAPLRVHRHAIGGCDREQAVVLHLGENRIGYLAKVDAKLTAAMKLAGATTVAELSLPMLLAQSQLVPQFRPVSPFPAIRRDLNMIVAEGVHWVDLETSTRTAIGLELAGVHYRETYRAPEKDGPQTKRILFSVELQRGDATLTGDEADTMVQAIINRCNQDHGARLLA